MHAKSQTKWRFVQELLKIVTPFRIGIGIGCISISLLIVTSLVITNVDRFLHSKCGLSCGYLVEENWIKFNPLDRLFVFTSKLFPLDLVFMTLILLYVFVVCIYAIANIGIRIFGQSFEIMKRETSPQALNILSILLILIMFAFSMQFVSLAPYYTTFGSQTASDGSTCSQSGKMQPCEATQISRLYGSIVG